MAANGQQQQPGKFTQLVELMRDSVITQAVVTVMALAATIGLLWEGKPVPGELWALDGLVVGFYFGGKVQSGAARLVEKHVAKLAEAASTRSRDDGPSSGSGQGGVG